MCALSSSSYSSSGDICGMLSQQLDSLAKQAWRRQAYSWAAYIASINLDLQTSVLEHHPGSWDRLLEAIYGNLSLLYIDLHIPSGDQILIFRPACLNIIRKHIWKYDVGRAYS